MGLYETNRSRFEQTARRSDTRRMSVCRRRALVSLIARDSDGGSGPGGCDQPIGSLVKSVNTSSSIISLI
jgi:hypothetical protein